MATSPPHSPPSARLPWAMAGVLAVVVATTGALLWRETRPVDRRLMRFNVDLGAEAITGITAPRPVISPDGTRLVFAVKSAAGKHQLATRLLDQPIPNVLAGTEDGVDPFFSPDGQWIGFFAGEKMKKVPVQGGAAVTLCDYTPGERGAAWGEDGNIIANLDIQHLFRVPAAGGKPQIVGRPEEHGEQTWRWPQILPGGENVLFTGAVASSGAAFDSANIEVLSLQSGQVKIVQRSGYSGRYLPSGHLVYVHHGTLYGVPFDPAHLVTRGTPTPLLEDVADVETGDGLGRIDFSRTGTAVYLSGGPAVSPTVWLDSTGKEQPAVNTLAQVETPRLSPDGNRLALTVEGDLWVYDLQRDAKTRLTFNAAHNRHPSWMPDGKHIVFGSGVSAPDGEYGIWWIRADGAGQAQKLFGDHTPLMPASISPDGRHVAFIRTTGSTNFAILTMLLDLNDPDHPKPAKPEPIPPEPTGVIDPAFSPDGRWLAYATTISGSQRRNIIVRPFPVTPSASRWQISSDNGRFPIWSRNGRELFYLGDDNHIMMTRYTAGPSSFVAEKPRQWSPAPLFRPANNALWNLDLAPDGKRFVVLAAPAGREEKATVHVTVLLNFLDELRRRIPGS